MRQRTRPLFQRTGMLSLVGMLSLAGMLSLTEGAAQADAGLTQRIAPYRKRAAKLAAQKKWDPALQQLSDAKELVRSETRREVTPAKPKIDPGFYKELAVVRQQLSEQARKEPRDAAHRRLFVEQFNARKALLLKKFHVDAANGVAASRWGRQRARQAQSGLLLASLDDVAAGYFAGKGDRERATASREDAALGRLRAYVILKQESSAAQAAEKLLKLSPANPEAYAEAGRFYQERKEWARAAQVWESGINRLRGGQVRMRIPDRPGAGPAERGTLLAECYRQVAFCYQQLGRKAEAQQAMESALEQDRLQGRR